MSKCDDCGLIYYYAPECHECSDKGSPVLKAEAERLRGESWVEQCMRMQREGKQ